MSKSIVRFILPLLLLAGFCQAEVRQPAVAGAFYPADPGELQAMVNEDLAQVENLPTIDGRIIAIIVPHAGLVYSGQIAAYCYKLLEGSGFDKVVLCGPSHRYGFDGVSVYGPRVEWLTPLGKVKCDDDLCQRLVNFDRGIGVIPAAHAQEHCLEVQLPYLQTVLGDFTIAPVIMGYPRTTTIDLLARALESLPADDNTLLVASSDWQHYKPASEGWKFDSLGIECIRDLNPDRLEKYLADDKTEACGGGSVVAVMKAAIARGANRVKILKHGDSGDVTGDKSSVVGYLAAVLYEANDEGARPEGDKMKKEPARTDQPSKFELGDSDRTELLRIARESIREYLQSGKMPEFEVAENLQQLGAGFVTLEKHEQLRGCIGYTEAFMPLYQAISDCAVQAAVADRRFSPVTLPELDSLHIEISVLTPLQRVSSLDEIQVGRDGLMISRGGYRGLLLPQVATHYGWDRDQFLMQTCHKAGLPADAYKSPDAVIYKFQAVIFGE